MWVTSSAGSCSNESSEAATPTVALRSCPVGPSCPGRGAKCARYSSYVPSIRWSLTAPAVSQLGVPDDVVEVDADGRGREVLRRVLAVLLAGVRAVRARDRVRGVRQRPAEAADEIA